MNDLIFKAEIETDVESKHVDTKGEGAGRNWESGSDMYTLLIPRVKQTHDEDMLFSRELHLMYCGDLTGKEVQKEGICVCIADLFCCTVETNIIKQLYSNKN